MIKSWLEHPLTHGMDLDDPRTTEVRQLIIREKCFLRKIYHEWYTSLARALPTSDGPVLELGSGAGFLKNYIPDLITSEVFFYSGARAILDGQQMPFASASLRGIVMTNVLHHLPQPRAFLSEAARCVYPGGVVAAIEPWVTPWSQLVYQRFHHEPFDPYAQTWEFPSSGPVSSANGALPWILFDRDRARFRQEFPEWRLRQICLTMPFRYLLSGGVSLRTLMPCWTFDLWRLVEQCLEIRMNDLAMFALIVLERTHEN